MFFIATTAPMIAQTSPFANLQWLNWAIVIIACCFAVKVDVRCRKIPNKLTGPMMLAGIIWWLITAGLGGLGDSFGGMAVAGLPFIVLWMMGGGGAGDAKMMLAIGAWLGFEHAFFATIGVGIAGGILSLIYAKAHHRLANALANTGWMVITLPFVLLGPGFIQDRQKLLPGSSNEKVKTPYSIAMLAGTIAAAGWLWQCAN